MKSPSECDVNSRKSSSSAEFYISNLISSYIYIWTKHRSRGDYRNT
ncbi:hypothetical protein OIU79_028765 [Salix purpurea]|uniref:Uncharacterized protein n=1 Tax=Salix purpurea TaxID=77065 RepID=A0A9Q0VWT7_SALPP|nr:hypothetical protein OIU79_028765 [Salix purpurea]